MTGKRSFVAQANVDPGTKETVEYEFDTSATITGLTVHTFSGQEFALLTDAYVVKDYGTVVPILDIGLAVDDEYPHALGGEDTDYDFSVEVEVQEKDTLVVEFLNRSSNFSYHGDCTVHYDEDFGRTKAILRSLNKVIS